MVHPSLLKRKIIHVDMDAFYASVEERDQPQLKTVPLVVGGDPNGRGVVSTANYEARRYGIRSAMACSIAKRMCPHAVFLSPNFSKYRDASEAIRKIFRRYTDQVEPLSLDEAYLDVTEHDMYATQIAKAIQDAIMKELQLPASAGVAPNKMLAKIASDWRKPFGITVIVPEKAEEFMNGLSLRKIPGVGPATEKRLLNLGLRVCADVKAIPQDRLETMLGERMAGWLSRRCLGIDDRGLSKGRVRKSMSTERTFAEDIVDKKLLGEKAQMQVRELFDTLANRQLNGRTLTLKLKYHNHQSITRSRTCAGAFWTLADAELALLELLDMTEAGVRPCRLVGVGLSNFEQTAAKTRVPTT